MRIRQIRPEFFTDPVTGRMSAPTQVVYIGLWCVCDDAGWLDWDVPQIGALLYPYRSVRSREAVVIKAAAELVSVGRLRVLDCGCARIPTLEHHQKIGGNKSYTGREKHEKHEVQTRMDLYARNVTVGNGSNGTREPDSAPHGSGSLRDSLIAAGINPTIVSKLP